MMTAWLAGAHFDRAELAGACRSGTVAVALLAIALLKASAFDSTASHQDRSPLAAPISRLVGSREALLPQAGRG